MNARRPGFWQRSPTCACRFPALCSAAWCRLLLWALIRPACFTIRWLATPLTASQVRECLKKIERDHGRTPDDKARGIVKIDIDLLCYDGEVLKPQDWLRVDVREGVAELASS